MFSYSFYIIRVSVIFRYRCPPGGKRIFNRERRLVWIGTSSGCTTHDKIPKNSCSPKPVMADLIRHLRSQKPTCAEGRSRVKRGMTEGGKGTLGED